MVTPLLRLVLEGRQRAYQEQEACWMLRLLLMFRNESSRSPWDVLILKMWGLL